MAGVLKTGTDTLWRTGQVDCVSIGRVVYRVASEKKTGLLLVSNNNLWMKALIHKGLLLDVKNNFVKGDTLGNYLIQQKMISQAEHKKSFERAKAKQIPQGRALVSMQILTEGELARCLTDHMTRKFLRLFSGMWDFGVHEFKDESISVDQFGMEPVPLFGLLKTGFMQVASCKDLIVMHERKNRMDSVMLVTDRLNQATGNLELDEDQVALTRSMHEKTLGKLQRAHADAFDSVVRLASLMLATEALVAERVKEAQSEPEKSAPILQTMPGQQERKPKRKKRRPPETKEERELRVLLSEAQEVLLDGDYNIAKDTLRKVLILDPGNLRASAMLYWAEFKLSGKASETAANICKTNLNQVSQKDPNNDLAHFFLGMLYKEEKDDTRARVHFIKARQINPDNKDIKEEIKLIDEKKKKQASAK